MSFVKQFADATAYSAVDSVDVAGGVTMEVGADGFGYVDSTGTFITLDAMPIGRQEVQLAVEAGSAATLAAVDGSLAAQFAAIDFATVDYVDAAEVAASATDALTPDQEGPGDKT